MSALRILRRSASLAGLLAAQVAAVIALYRLGSHPPFRVPLHHLGPWLRLTTPADVLVAGLRLVALAGASWLLLGTVLYAAARLIRLPGAVRATGRLTLPAVRRVVDGALAASLVTGATFAGLGAGGAGVGGVAFADAVVHVAADPPPTTVAVRDGRSGGGLASLPAEPTSTTTPATTTSPPRPAAGAPAPAPLPAAPAGAPVVPSATAVPWAVVAPGDNLWELTATYLAARTGRARADVPDAEVAPYWVEVCEWNRPALRSGDPDLIYPGEVVTFPLDR